MATKRALAATDRRRHGYKRPQRVDSDKDESNGSGSSLTHLFSDRRKPNATGKRAD